MSLAPPPPAALGGFCGRCGAAVDPGAPFCGRCGNPVAAVQPAAVGYTYPVVPSATVPAARRKVRPARLYAVGGGALALLVVVITAIAVFLRPTAPAACTYGCGPPQSDLRYVTANAYANQKWGYVIDYPGGALTVGDHNDDSVTLGSTDGLPLIKIRALSGSDVNAAVQDAVNSLSSSQFQDLQPQGPLNGAEMGGVLGSGVILRGASTQGGSNVPVGMVVLAASRNNVTLVAIVIGEYSKKVATGVRGANALDYTLTNLAFPGGQ